MTHTLMEDHDDTAGQLLNRKMMGDLYSQDTHKNGTQLSSFLERI